MSFFNSPSARQINLGLALLRIVAGFTLAAHGHQKVFTYGVAGVTAGFTQMGIPLASLVGPGVAYLELIGGIALIAGVLARPFALLLAFDMLGAIVLAHLSAGFFLPKGYEFVLVLFAIAMTIAITGAGAYSIDGIIASRSAAGKPQPDSRNTGGSASSAAHVR